MNRGKLLIALVVAAVLTIGVGSSLIPSGAATGSVLVKVSATGTVISVPGCLPVGANVAGGVVIQGCDPAPTPTVQVAPTPTTPTQSTPAATTPTTGTTTENTPTNTTPDDTPDDEPAADTPDKQQTTGGVKGDRDKADTGSGKSDGSSKDEGSSKDSDSTKDDKDAGNDNTSDTTNADGSPSLSNPSVTLADAGPAPIGVPNFVIDSFKIPPFLLPIYKAAEAQYNIPWQILAAVNEIETDYGRNLSVSTAGAVGLDAVHALDLEDVRDRCERRRPPRPLQPGRRDLLRRALHQGRRRRQGRPQGPLRLQPANWYVDSVLLRAKVIGGLSARPRRLAHAAHRGSFPCRRQARAVRRPALPAQATRRVAAAPNASIPSLRARPATRSTSSPRRARR